MEFPSRDEARVYAAMQSQGAAPGATKQNAAPTTVPVAEQTSARPGDGTRFRIERVGFEKDVFDRRALRTLIRTGDITDRDLICVDDAKPVSAGDVPDLKSLFALRKTSRVTPPLCCRTHTERVAFYRCVESSRPLCDDCVQVKKFGNTTVRLCQHCSGIVADLAPAPA
jgi:hypothetical protein